MLKKKKPRSMTARSLSVIRFHTSKMVGVLCMRLSYPQRQRSCTICFLLMVNDVTKREFNVSKGKKYMQAYQNWVMYLISKCHGVEQVLPTCNGGLGVRDRGVDSQLRRLMPILSSRVRTILALSPGSGFSSSLGSMLTLEVAFACCSGCLFSSDSLRSLASSKAAMSSEVIAIAVGFRRSILTVERYCNEPKEDLAAFTWSGQEGGASRDCNYSFNLSASLYQNVLGTRPSSFRIQHVSATAEADLAAL